MTGTAATSAPTQQHPRPDGNGIWVRWLIGLLLGVCIATTSFAFGLTRADAVQEEQNRENSEAIKELKNNQRSFATKEEVRQMRDDLSYIRNRLDQIWGPPLPQNHQRR